MWSTITSIISVIRALLDLWKYWKNYQDTQRQVEAQRRQQERARAIEDLKNAKTQDEIFDAQDRIVRNKL